MVLFQRISLIRPLFIDIILKRSVPNLMKTSSTPFSILSTLKHPDSAFETSLGCRRMASSCMPGSHIVPQDFDFFLVLDFEATCLDNQRIEPQEIIEFPVLKVNGRTFQTESIFHQYVEPQVHGVGDFCTKLTGITPSMVKGQPTFQETLKLFHIWMENEGLLNPDIKFIFVTCGDWDFKTMLPSQCAHFEIPYHSYFRRWLNIKKAYAAVTSHYPKGMMQMLENLKIPHVGRHHSGIDDCRNIANILSALARRRYKFKQTGSR